MKQDPRWSEEEVDSLVKSLIYFTGGVLSNHSYEMTYPLAKIMYRAVLALEENGKK